MKARLGNPLPTFTTPTPCENPSLRLSPSLWVRSPDHKEPGGENGKVGVDGATWALRSSSDPFWMNAIE